MMHQSREREMHAMRDTRQIQPWRDWLLLIAGLVALLVPLDLVADATYHSDGSVLYWFLTAYSYPDGTPAATVIGLVVLALALLAYWIVLRLLARAGLSPARSLAIVALTALASIFAVFTLVVGPLIEDGSLLFSGPVALSFGLFTVALMLGLHAFIRGSRAREQGPQRTPWMLLGLVALAAVVTLLAITVAPVALLVGERSVSYNHLAGGDFQNQRYYLTLERHPSDGSRVLLYRCDTLGVWCRQIDALSTSGDGQSDGGRLRYDTITRTLTASEGDHLLITYPAGDLFEGP
jgi:hypothetical protein